MLYSFETSYKIPWEKKKQAQTDIPSLTDHQNSHKTRSALIVNKNTSAAGHQGPNTWDYAPILKRNSSFWRKFNLATCRYMYIYIWGDSQWCDVSCRQGIWLVSDLIIHTLITVTENLLATIFVRKFTEFCTLKPRVCCCIFTLNSQPRTWTHTALPK